MAREWQKPQTKAGSDRRAGCKSNVPDHSDTNDANCPRNSLVILIPVALAMGMIGPVAFLWMLKSNYYEDLDGAAERVLFDDDDT